MIIQLTFERGAIGTIEVNADSGYGYEVAVEITAETGLLRSPEFPSAIHRHSGTRSTDIPPDWLVRFEHAYVEELQIWVQSLSDGQATGPSAWDGYRSLAIADATIRSIDTGQSEPVKYIAKPTLYGS